MARMRRECDNNETTVFFPETREITILSYTCFSAVSDRGLDNDETL